MAVLFTIILNFTYSLAGAVTNVSETYPVDPDTVGANNVQVRIQGTIGEAGLYELSISSTFLINAINNSVFRRFSLDGGATWDESSEESKDATDKKFRHYSFPLDHSAGQVIDYILQLKKEASADNLDVFTASIWLTRIT